MKKSKSKDISVDKNKDPKYGYTYSETEKIKGKFVAVESIGTKRIAVAYLEDAKKAEKEGRVKILAEKGSPLYSKLVYGR